MMWELFWGVFLVICLLIFAYAEGVALWSKAKGDTLSENIRKWLNKKWKRWTFGIGWVVFVVWFVPHILFGWW